MLDLTERKRAEAALRNVQMELAHANRVATMGREPPNLMKDAVSVHTELVDDLPLLEGDRVELQQVIEQNRYAVVFNHQRVRFRHRAYKRRRGFFL